MKRLFIAISLLLTLAQPIAAELRDLTRLKQSFVLETKRIHVPGFPNAFNPSIVSWRGRLLMSFRSYDEKTQSTDAIYLVWLDKNFNPVSTPELLKREGEITCYPSRAQDPRLIVVDDELHIVYSNLYPHPIPASRMVMGVVEEDECGGFLVSFPTPLIHYHGKIDKRKEKNWVPFANEKKLFLAYSLQPHRIFLPHAPSYSCVSICSTIGTLKWDWGNLLGGTPALRIGNSYLGFFHSNKALATVQSEGEILNHYFMGAYTFEAEYPFSLTGISPHPVVARTFYEGEMYEGKTWKPLRVVFPAGIVVDEKFVWVSYGRQDNEAWVVKLDKAGLLSSLVPVNMIKMSIK